MTFSPSYLYSILAADNGVKALAKTGTTFRCYPDTAPIETPRPFLVYSHIWGNKERPALVDVVRFQIDAYADTKSASFALADAVDKALENYSGVQSDGFVIEGSASHPVQGTYDPVSKLYRYMVEVRMVGYHG